MFLNDLLLLRHGVKQRLNCWADGVPMVTQCPILPGHNFTYRFDVAGQEGTLWWHAHVFSLRGTVHGAFIIRPRRRADADDSYYPFPKPHAEVPIVIGEWWETDLEQMDRDFAHGHLDDQPSAATINGKLGDLFRACEGAGVEDGYVLDVEPGKTYLLRVVNAALFSEYYLRIAGHVFTVVAGDANYVRPYRTDVLAVSPGGPGARPGVRCHARSRRRRRRPHCVCDPRAPPGTESRGAPGVFPALTCPFRLARPRRYARGVICASFFPVRPVRGGGGAHGTKWTGSCGVLLPMWLGMLRSIHGGDAKTKMARPLISSVIN